MGHIHRMTVAPERPEAVRSHVLSQSLRAMLGSSLLPRTIRLCIHCRQNPAGFWVSRENGSVTRRPWCLSCSHQLDRGRYAVTPFGG
jgi:hypothetical protein